MKKATIPPLAALTGAPADRMAQLKARLADAAARGGHAAPALVAVSKTFGADAIRPLLAAGHRLFGENRVQEAATKWPALMADHRHVELHLVGQLQSNKALEAVQLFDAIHSIDRLSLVRAVAASIDRTGRSPTLFVQVNLGAEPQKGGVAPDGLVALLDACQGAGLRISGLMTVPPADREPAPYFALLADMGRRHGLAQLSMGMSADHDIAASLGATHVRIGSALFGGRAVMDAKK